MTPFQIRRERMSEFCLLIKRLERHDKGVKEKPKPKDGKERQYIPVTDYKPIKKEVTKDG